MKETLVIKDHLHKLVVETEDVEVLLQVEAFFESLVGQRDWWDDLTEIQKNKSKQLNRNWHKAKEFLMKV
jgi:hypothetical protein